MAIYELFMCVCEYTYVHTYIYLHICIYVCIYTYIYTHAFLAAYNYPKYISMGFGEGEGGGRVGVREGPIPGGCGVWGSWRRLGVRT